jgi:hypothetical protein
MDEQRFIFSMQFEISGKVILVEAIIVNSFEKSVQKKRKIPNEVFTGSNVFCFISTVSKILRASRSNI